MAHVRKYSVSLSPVAISVTTVMVLGLGLFAKGISLVRPAIIGTQKFGETKVEGTVFPKLIKNAGGDLVQTVSSPPKRIASVMLAADEILASLAPERLIAVTYLVDDVGISNCSNDVPKSAIRLHSDIESVLAAEPDMVFVAGYTPMETVQLLAAAGIAVIHFSQYDSFADIMNNVLLAGNAIGKESEAQKVISNMKSKIASVEKRVMNQPRPRVLYYSSYGYTSGSDTSIDEMIEKAGGSNAVRIAGLKGPAQLSIETAISLQPEVIIVSAWEAGAKGKIGAVEELLGDPIWKDVPAIREKRICLIRGAWLTAVSPYAVYGLEEVARCLHPELFH